MSDTVLTQRGQALSLTITWYQGDPAGPKLDLTGATLSVREASRSVLMSAALAVTDAEEGLSTLAMTETQADQLGDGRVNWFRLEAQFTDGSNRVTPKIWINVR